MTFESCFGDGIDLAKLFHVALGDPLRTSLRWAGDMADAITHLAAHILADASCAELMRREVHALLGDSEGSARLEANHAYLRAADLDARATHGATLWVRRNVMPHHARARSAPPPSESADDALRRELQRCVGAWGLHLFDPTSRSHDPNITQEHRPFDRHALIDIVRL